MARCARAEERRTGVAGTVAADAATRRWRVAVLASCLVALAALAAGACGRAKVPIRGREAEAPTAAPVPTPGVAPTPAGAAPAGLPLPSTEVWDFGTVPIGTVVHHVFTIQNDGDRPLQLKRARKACGCTTAMVPGGIVPAGGSGWVEVSIDTSRIPGRGSQSVVLKTDSPSRPEIVLVMQGTVVPDISASPERVFLGRLRSGQTVSRVVEVEVAEGVTTPRVTKEGPFKVRATRLGAPRRGLRLDVTFTAGGPRGPFDYEIAIETTSPRQPSIVIPVLGVIR